MRHAAPLGLGAVLLAAVAAAARGVYDARPPLAHTGGFGEPTCAVCHFGGPEQPTGRVSLGGVPGRYVPGELYTLEVTLADTTARAGGFQLAARVAYGRDAGQQAGTLCAIDARTVVATDSASGVQYVSHAGAAPADSLRWRFTWRAPARHATFVTFNVAANAADDDDSPLGDAILAESFLAAPKDVTSGSESRNPGCDQLPATRSHSGG